MKRKVILFSIFIAVFLLSTCQTNYPPKSKYQIVGLIPLSSVYQGDLFLADNELILLHSNEPLAYDYSFLKRYNLTNPINPEVISEIQLSSPFNIYYNYGCYNSYIFANSYYNLEQLSILNTENGDTFLINLNFRVYSLAFKDTLMFGASDSGMVIWNIANIRNPMVIFREIETTFIYQGKIAVDDTFCYELLSNNRYNLWSIVNPNSPWLISSGNEYYWNVNKIIFYNRKIYAGSRRPSLWWGFRRFAINDSGQLVLEEQSNNFDEEYISDFLIDNNLIYVIAENRTLVGNANNFSDTWEEIPFVWGMQFQSFCVYHDIIYALFSRQGIFIYKKVEE